nr:MAG TPA: hypothetical protein [Caudoviricetes sp.]
MEDFFPKSLDFLSVICYTCIIKRGEQKPSKQKENELCIW